MTAALYALSAAAAALAWALCRRRPEHVPIALLFTVGLVADVARRLLRAAYLGAAIERLGGDAPWTGGARVAALTSHALFLAWPAALAACALVVFLGRRPWLALTGYVVGLAALVVTRPIAGDGSLGRALAAENLVGLAAAVGSAATWYLRSREPTTTAQAILALTLAGELASLAGSWRIGIFASWQLSQIAYLVTFAVLTVLQGGFLWQSRSS